MYKYVFNTKGKYVAFIVNDKYCFSPENEYIGFFKGIKLYNYNGKYLGELTSDDRIIRNKNINYNKVNPILKPLKPLKPLRPFNRLSMPSLPSNYEDIFFNEILNEDIKLLDNKYNKLIGTNIYSAKGVFLGKINFNKYDKDSIANKYGNYGSEYSQKSVFNKYGNYGSPYSNESPFNEYTKTPPILKDKNNKIVGVLTTNHYLNNNIDAVEFFKWFNLKLEK